MTSAKPKRPYQVCARCVMDTTAEEISFDGEGVCNFCHDFEQRLKPTWHPDERGRAFLAEIAERIRRDGQGHDYDCLFGVSGGIDSTFMALQIKKLGLRPLVVHVDTGWNSELAVHNIEGVVRTLGFDLHTVVIDWDEMRDLQAAFFRAGVVNQDIPQDNAIFATLHRVALESGIRYLFQGFNIVTESILPMSWGFDNMDSRHIRAIHRRFGRRPLASYPLLDFAELCTLRYGFPEAKPYETIALLNYMPYVREEAIRAITEELGFRDYGTKHGESLFTKFYQEYFLPQRFGIDKRRPHYSSLIVAGQLDRAEALERLKSPAHSPEHLDETRAYFVKKLNVPDAEFDRFLNGPIRAHHIYASYQSSFRIAEELAQHSRDLHTMWANLAQSAEA